MFTGRFFHFLSLFLSFSLAFERLARACKFGRNPISIHIMAVHLVKNVVLYFERMSYTISYIGYEGCGLYSSLAMVIVGW